jgi:hypothetical protein
VSYPPSGTFEGRNFITPDIIRYGRVGEHWYELSQGSGIYGETVFGVTFRTSEGEPLIPDPSSCCHSREDAETLIRETREEIKRYAH